MYHNELAPARGESKADKSWPVASYVLAFGLLMALPLLITAL